MLHGISSDFLAIKNLRLERDEILSLITDKKQQCKPLVSPQQSFEHDT